MLMKKSKKTGRTDKLSAEQAHAILSEFFIGNNLLHAKSIFYDWHEAGFSAQGSLRIVFSEML